MLFLQDVMRESAISAKQSGEKGVSARRVRKVREVCISLSLLPSPEKKLMVWYRDVCRSLEDE